jgi:hypothetical protein
MSRPVAAALAALGILVALAWGTESARAEPDTSLRGIGIVAMRGRSSGNGSHPLGGRRRYGRACAMSQS